MRPSLPLISLLALAAHARAELPTDFPPDAVPITAKSFEEQVAGKLFKGTTDAGGYWWMDFRKDGTLFWGSRGTGDFGKWRIEGDKFCGDMEVSPSTCNDFRIKENLIFYKRQSNGEVVALSQQPGGNIPIGKWKMTYKGPSTGRPMEAKVDIDGPAGTWQLLDIASVARAPCIGRDFPAGVVAFTPDEFAIRVEADKLMKGCGIMGFILKKVDDNTYEGIGFSDNRKITFTRR